MPFVLPLSAIGAGDRGRVGSKAANLGELLREGQPVPPGFCVTCEGYEAHLDAAALRARLRERMAAVKLRGSDEGASAELRSWILAAPLPAALVGEIERAYRGLGESVAVAVRSSAADEDLASASFAGQHDTYLGVQGLLALFDAVRSCWASLYSERALAYRLRSGLAVEDPSIACLVQLMVPAEAAGVAFSADPLTGRRDRVVINAVRGLGEALVSGRVSADQYVLVKSDRTLADQRVVSGVPLADATLVAIAGLVAAAETRYSMPQDIEWALAGGQVFLLQARPITNLLPEPVPLAEARRPILCYPDRIREMVPSALTPLTADIALRVIVPAVNEAIVHHGLMPASLVRRTAGFARVVRGRLYLDASAMRALLPGLDELALVDFLDRGEPPPLRALRPALIVTLIAHAPRALRKAWPLLERLDRLSRRMSDELDGLLRPLEKEDLGTWSRERLVDLIEAKPTSAFREGLIAMPPANALARGLLPPIFTALERMVVRWTDEGPGAAGSLLSGLTGLIEVECGAALWDLAQRAREVPVVIAALRTAPEVALDGLRAQAGAAEWLEGFDAFLARFGHRAIEEVELARPRWRESPGYLLSVIANYLECGAAASPRSVEERRRGEREALEARIEAHLRKRPLRRRLFRLVLRTAQMASVAGENTKFDIVRLLALQRAAALELGRRLEEAGSLADRGDVFFLELADLRRDGADLLSLVTERRKAYGGWQLENPPRVIDDRGRPVLEGLRAPSRAAAGVLKGLGSSPGKARGRVRIVRDPSAGARLAPGEILVAPYTDPAWTPLFFSAGAVVVEVGSLLSHASIVARELGIPSVVAVANAMSLLSDGDEVEVDGIAGTVTTLVAHGPLSLPS